jgi:hypothetical protein
LTSAALILSGTPIYATQPESPKAMCSNCASSLGDLVRPHLKDACPLNKGMYCSVCATYGHAPTSCPEAFNDDSAPQFLEQLIPPYLLQKYGIVTQTPLGLLPPLPSPPVKPPIEVLDLEDEIRACLISHGGKPMVCQAVGKEEKREYTENKKRLQKIAEGLGRKLILVPPPTLATPEKVVGKSRKTFQLKVKS